MSAVTTKEAPVRVAKPLDVPLGSPTRPSWRGRSHLFAFLIALPLLVILAILANGAKGRAGVIVYTVGLCSMFGVSTIYHRRVHTIRARKIWQRADHATIYAAIAGTYTPVCLVAVGGPWGIGMLIFIWSGAACGAAMKAVNWRYANGVGAFLYIGLGWAGLSVVPAMWQRSGVFPVICLMAGGLLYTIGAIGFRRQWPRLSPSTFSYHEVWHLFTIAAAAVHVVAVWMVVT